MVDLVNTDKVFIITRLMIMAGYTMHIPVRDLDRASYLFELIAAELLNKFGLLIMSGLFITQQGCS